MDTQRYLRRFPESAGSLFHKNNYKVEARIPSFYNGEETCLFLGKFLQKNRQNSSDQETIQFALKTAEEKPILADSPTLPNEDAMANL